MKKSKLVVLLLFVLIVAITLPACGNDKGEKEDAASEKLSGSVEVIGTETETWKVISELGDEYKKSDLKDEKALEAKMLKDDFDIAIMSPTKAAQFEAKEKNKIIALSPTNIGQIYLVANGYVKDDEEINSYLSNKTITVLGEGTTEEYIMKKVLENEGIYGTEITYVKNIDEFNEAMKIYNAVGLVLGNDLGKVTKNESVDKVFNVSQLWDEKEGSEAVTEMIVVNKAFAKDRKNDLKIFIKDYEEAMEKVKGKTVFYGESNRGNVLLKAFYQTLYDFSRESLGNELPGDNFYY